MYKTKLPAGLPAAISLGPSIFSSGGRRLEIISEAVLDNVLAKIVLLFNKP